MHAIIDYKDIGIHGDLSVSVSADYLAIDNSVHIQSQFTLKSTVKVGICNCNRYPHSILHQEGCLRSCKEIHINHKNKCIVDTFCIILRVLSDTKK